MRRWLRYGLLCLVSAGILPAVAAQEACGNLLPESARYQSRQDDYLDPHQQARRHLALINRSHFRPQIRRFDGHPMHIMNNLDYTLRHFPNHHEALYAVSRFERRMGGTLPQNDGWDWRRSAECYFIRAVRFRPDDGVVRMLYGIHLHKTGKLEEALEQYQAGLELVPNSSELHYNLGLLYFDLEKYELAKKQASRAYQLGYPLGGLKKLLAERGYWP